MTQVEKCSCGSGRPAEQCCGKSASGGNARLVIVGALVVLATGGLTALGISVFAPAPEAPAPLTTPAPVVTSSTGGSVAQTLGTGQTNLQAPFVGTPQPYQYDAPNNRYWDPSHNHWHAGQPPVNAPNATPLATTSQPPAGVNTINTLPRGANIPPPSSPTANLNSKGEVPQPWEYDEVDNTHFDPVHGHWHQGPPPEDKVREWKEKNGGG